MQSFGRHQPLLSHTGRLRRTNHLVVDGNIAIAAAFKPISIGDAIAWEERCRIKHLPTRMYLAVVKDKNNSLKVCL